MQATATNEQLEAFFEKVDRIIKGDTLISLKIGGSQSYANLRTKEINLSPEMIPADVTDEIHKLSVLKGLNIHELGHILFTRINTKYADSEVADIANALEDGRIESLLSIYYPKSKEYLLIAYYCLIWRQKHRLSAKNYLACRSRKAILDDEEIITFLANKFDEDYPEIRREVDKLIDEYLTTNSLTKQSEVCKKIKELMTGANQNHTPNRGFERYDSTTKSQKINGQDELLEELKQILDEKPDVKQSKTKAGEKNVEKKRELEEAKKKLEQLEKEWNNTYTERDKLLEEKSKIENEILRARANKEDTKKLEEKKAEKQAELDTLSNKRQNNSSEQRRTQNKIEEIKDQIRENDFELPEELENKVGEYVHGKLEETREETTEDLESATGQTSDRSIETKPTGIDRATRAQAEHIKQVFNILKNDYKKGRHSGYRNGTVNIQRAMTYKKTGNAKIFDKTIPDQSKKQKLGIIILLDASGSMKYQIDNVLKASWAIKEGLQNTDNKLAIIAYNDNYRVIKGFEDKGNYQLDAGGYTNPTGALDKAEALIKKDKTIKNWLLILMTDGMFVRWGDHDGGVAITKIADEKIAKLNKKGVETILIDYGAQTNGKHNCKHVLVVKDDKTLAQSFKNIVEKARVNIQRNVLRNIGVMTL